MNRRLFVVLVIAAVVFATALDKHASLALAQGPCPTPSANVDTPTAPPDVAIPPCAGFPIAFFDDYSWRTFLAMVWPAGSRGTPDLSKDVSDGTASGSSPLPRVFETFKQDWEIFNGVPLPATTMMPPFNVVASPNPCGPGAAPWNQVVLGSFTFSKLGNLGQADNSAAHLSGPIVAQNQTYVRYETAFNETSYDAINAGRRDLPTRQNGFTLPNGSISIKAAWMDMESVPNPQRFYTTSALVWDPGTRTCSQRTMGLVALHIVQKTPSRPQWIWTTFEHVDNVPGSGGGPLSFNDGTGATMPPTNPHGFPPSPMPPPPFNVVRDPRAPINPSTAMTNRLYQAALRSGRANSVWANYQLVMTQWPIPNPPTNPTVDPNQSADPPQTFPGSDNTSAVANPVMETFEQAPDPTGIGCMSCHSTMQQRTDFVWALRVNALHNLTAPNPQPAVNAITAQAATLPRTTQEQLSDDLTCLRYLVEKHLSNSPAPKETPLCH
jgi:hypothetical protein